MGKSKNRKKKKPAQVVRLSPEKYIKTKGRNLPIHECLILDGWQERGLAQIFVARKMPSGNICLGIYLVDHFCLGLKDTAYQFNLTLSEYEDLKGDFGRNNMGECSYDLVHNLIFDAIEFAAEYKFKAHKDFRISQYLLEDDETAEVEMIDIEMGKDGKPFLMTGPFDNPQQLINHLTAVAGPGGFDYIARIGGEEGAYDEDEFDEFIEGGDDEEVREKLVTLMAGFINHLFDERVVSKELRERKDLISVESLTEGVVIDDAMADKYVDMLVGDVGTDFNKLLNTVEADLDKANNLVDSFIEKYPGMMPAYQIKALILNLKEQPEKSNQILKEAYLKDPDYLIGKIAYIVSELSHERLGEAEDFIGDKRKLSDFIEDRSAFSSEECREIYTLLGQYFILKSDIVQADIYLSALHELLSEEELEVMNVIWVDNLVMHEKMLYLKENGILSEEKMDQELAQFVMKNVGVEDIDFDEVRKELEKKP